MPPQKNGLPLAFLGKVETSKTAFWILGFEIWIIGWFCSPDFTYHEMNSITPPTLWQEILFFQPSKKTNLLKISSLLSKSCAVIPLLKKSIGFIIILKPWPSSPSSSPSPMFGPNHREKFPQFLDKKNRCRSKEDGQTAMALQLGEGGFLCHVVNAKHRQESPTSWLLILISEGTSK